MSGDEIVFDEVRYRQPQRRRRPDFDRRFACLTFELPEPSDLPVFLDLRAADAIERHALRDTSVELGGVLLGKECLDDRSGRPFVWVTEALEARHYENTQASFTYTHDAWEDINRERDRLHPDLDIVGWYHTHPDFGIFLSGHDQFLHRNFFPQPLQVAYVVDPIRRTRGFFQWRGETLTGLGGFHLAAPRNERVALARLVNEFEQVAGTDTVGPGPGSGLSPRLEAELIAMLNRTNASASPASPTERAMVALLFGFAGLIVGVAGLLALLWLGDLTQSSREQGRRLDVLATSVERSHAAERLALESLAANAKSDQRDPDALLTQYQKTLRSLDELQHRLDDQATINQALSAQSRTYQAENVEMKAELERARGFEKDAKDTPALRERVATLEADNRQQSAKLSEQDEVLGSLAGKQAAALMQRYDRAWYAAVVGWTFVMVLALGLAASHILKPAVPHATRPEETGDVGLPSTP